MCLARKEQARDLPARRRAMRTNAVESERRRLQFASVTFALSMTLLLIPLCWLFSAGRRQDFVFLLSGVFPMVLILLRWVNRMSTPHRHFLELERVRRRRPRELGVEASQATARKSSRRLKLQGATKTGAKGQGRRQAS